MSDSRLAWTSDSQADEDRYWRERYAAEDAREAEEAEFYRVIPVEVAPGDIDYIRQDRRTGEYEYN